VNRLALAIARDRSDLPDLAGTARFTARGLAILHVQAPPDALSPGLETIEAYASAVASLHARETILPLRFGSLHESLDGFDDWLRVRSEEWRALLDEVEDCDEIGVRVLLDPPEQPVRAAPTIADDRPGTAYLNALKARHDASTRFLEEASRVADQFQKALAGTFRQSTVENPGPGRERLLSLTYLVPRPSLGRFREAFEPFRGQNPGKMLLSGPWPPYSYASSNEILL
jgi:hypothetical protein